MTTNQKSESKAHAGKAKSPAKKPPLLRDDPITPRPAFRAFSLEDDRHGRRRMRSLGKVLGEAKYAPNALHEADSLYMAALGMARRETFSCMNPAGEIVHREKRPNPTPEEAARDLLTIAKDATILLTELFNQRPELFQSIAAREACWPVMADLTEKDWQRQTTLLVDRLNLGKDIKGYLLAARTADENVIRCWATAIYETLFQTRFFYKEAMEGKSTYGTTEGCPAWARKSLDLPPFTKVDFRKWAKLGEEMLLQQLPDFLDSPDLLAKKRSWTHRAQKDSRSGRASLRSIHREAFEDFAKELKNIAPEPGVWRGDW